MLLGVGLRTTPLTQVGGSWYSDLTGFNPLPGVSILGLTTDNDMRP